MKVYSIGRSHDCDIVIADNSDVVSRRHAILTIYPSGKMSITDLSTNGTFVNGSKISSNVAVPVTRKDSVSFAHVSKLDWKLIPKFTPAWVWVLVAAVVTAIISLGAIKAVNLVKNRQPSGNKTEISTTQPKDSTVTVKKDTVVIRDTIKIKEPRKKEKAAKEGSDKKKEQKDTTSTHRVIG